MLTRQRPTQETPRFVGAIVLATAQIWAGTAQTATYYVSPTGNAAWVDCTNINTPCSAHMAMAEAMRDDIVFFRGGTYVPTNCTTWEYVSFQPAYSGTPGHHITFKAYPGESPVMAACPNAMPAFGSRDADYIIWDGFSGTLNPSSYTSWLFLYWASTGSIVRNCNFTGNVINTGNNAPISIVQSSQNEVYDNVVHDNMSNSDPENTNSAGIWIFETAEAKVHHNTIYNTICGIMQKTGPNIDNEYYNNFIHSVADMGIMLNEQSDVGGSGIRVYSNVIVNAAGAGIDIYGANALQHDYQVYNNVIYGIGGGITVRAYARNAQLWNNIIYQTNEPFLTPFLRYFATVESFPSYADYNNYYHATSLVWAIEWSYYYTTLDSWRAATNPNYDLNSRLFDPVFMDPGGADAEDFKLDPTYPSPAINAGIDRQDYDMDGDTTEPINMGAFITGNEIIGATVPSGNPAPSAPVSLRVE